MTQAPLTGKSGLGALWPLRLTACVPLHPVTGIWLVPVTGIQPVTGTACSWLQY